jgi:tripartite-type tricarboxylate transporter receptor subunit TctC
VSQAIRSRRGTGLLAPARTPQAIVGRLNAEVLKIMRLPDMMGRLSGGGSGAFARHTRGICRAPQAEIAKWGKVIKSAGLAGTE